jgi:hypothetical protein
VNAFFGGARAADSAITLAAELKAKRERATRSAAAARLEGDTAAFAVGTASALRRTLTRASALKRGE